MGAYVRKKAALVVWAKIALYASSVKRIRPAGRFFFSCRFCSLAHLDGGLEKRREGDASRD